MTRMIRTDGTISVQGAGGIIVNRKRAEHLLNAGEELGSAIRSGEAYVFPIIQTGTDEGNDDGTQAEGD